MEDACVRVRYSTKLKSSACRAPSSFTVAVAFFLMKDEAHSTRFPPSDDVLRVDLAVIEVR